MINWFYGLTCNVFWVFFKILFRIQAKGLENIPESGGFILASNHVSLLDPIALASICNRHNIRLNYMSKEELFRNPFFAFLITRLGLFPVKRKSHDVGAIREALRRLKGGMPLLLFPEGGRSSGGDILDTQPGAAMLSVHTSVPILPAFVKGSENALPKGARFIRLKKIIVYFGKPFYIEKSKDYQKATNRIKDAIVALSRAA